MRRRGGFPCVAVVQAGVFVVVAHRLASQSQRLYNRFSRCCAGVSGKCPCYTWNVALHTLKNLL